MFRHEQRRTQKLGRAKARPLTAARRKGSLVGGESFRVELRKNQGFSESRGGSASQLEFQRRLH